MLDYNSDLVGKTLLTTLPREHCTFKLRHSKQNVSLTKEEATQEHSPQEKGSSESGLCCLVKFKKQKMLEGEGGHGRGIQASKKLRWILQGEHQRMFKKTSEGQRG